MSQGITSGKVCERSKSLMADLQEMFIELDVIKGIIFEIESKLEGPKPVKDGIPLSDKEIDGILTQADINLNQIRGLRDRLEYIFRLL